VKSKHNVVIVGKRARGQEGVAKSYVGAALADAGY
jgi:hypothetical protein